MAGALMAPFLLETASRTTATGEPSR